MTPFKFRCSYCNKGFKTEGYFKKHTCKQMIREQEMKTVDGQNAFEYYKKWLRFKKRRSNATIPEFVKSNHFDNFVKFAQFAKKVKIEDIDAYIKLMIKTEDLQPSFWTNDLAYKEYTLYCGRRVSPEKQLIDTIDYLDWYCEKKGIDTADFFDSITTRQLMSILIKRKLSPWLLFHSAKFLDIWENLPNDEFRIVNNLVPYKYWVEQFEGRPKQRKLAKKVARELGL